MLCLTEGITTVGFKEQRLTFFSGFQDHTSPHFISVYTSLTGEKGLAISFHFATVTNVTEDIKRPIPKPAGGIPHRVQTVSCVRTQVQASSPSLQEKKWYSAVSLSYLLSKGDSDDLP